MSTPYADLLAAGAPALPEGFRYRIDADYGYAFVVIVKDRRDRRGLDRLFLGREETFGRHYVEDPADGRPALEAPTEAEVIDRLAATCRAAWEAVAADVKAASDREVFHRTIRHYLGDHP